MEATENGHRLARDDEVDQVGKLAHHGSTDGVMHLWIEVRVAGDPTEDTVDSGDEVGAKPRLLCFIPLKSLKEVELGKRSNEENKNYLALPRRARTSDQGLPDSG